MANKFWKLVQVMEATGLSRSSIYAYMAAGTFPAAINIGPRSVAWVEIEVSDWIADRIDASRMAKKNGKSRAGVSA